VAVAVGPDLLLVPADAVADAVVLRLDAADRVEAVLEVVRSDADAKLALVRVNGQRLNFAPLAAAEATGAVSCVGFPKVSLFEPAKQTIAGRASAASQEGWSVSLDSHPRLAGAPLFDAAGALCGVVAAERDDPAAKLPAVSASQIRAFLAADAPAGGGGMADVFQLSVEAEAK
jgi:hypothetical protein